VNSRALGIVALEGALTEFIDPVAGLAELVEALTSPFARTFDEAGMI